VCLSEHCVYTKNGNEILLILYVDDMIISSKRKEDSDGLIVRLKEQFDIGEEGPLNWYLGMAIDDKGTSIKLSQRDYVDKMLTKYHYEELSTEETPMVEKYQIDKDPEDEFFPRIRYTFEDRQSHVRVSMHQTRHNFCCQLPSEIHEPPVKTSMHRHHSSVSIPERNS
jgi:hypothetical protein